MMGLDQMAVFVSVVEEGGFTAASRKLGMPKSSVSRKVADLESRLGLQLLVRTTRSVRTTEVGERFYEQARVGVEAFHRAEQVVDLALDEPRGVLRVTTMPGGEQMRLTQLIDRYLTTFPLVSVELHTDLRQVDLVREGFDVAIRARVAGAPEDSSLTMRSVGTMQVGLYAAPAYLEREGRPEHPSDVEQHSCVLFGAGHVERGATWELTRAGVVARVRSRGRIRVNSLEMARDLAAAGHGIVSLPHPAAKLLVDAGRLERVLPHWSSGTGTLHLVFPGSRLVDPKTRGFIEMAVEHFEGLLERHALR